MKLFSIQRAPMVDGMDEEGNARYRTPYPFVVDEEGNVRGQEFWKGEPLHVMGFQKDFHVQRVDVRWEEAIKDLKETVGMYLVVIDKDGTMGSYETAIQSCEEVRNVRTP